MLSTRLGISVAITALLIQSAVASSYFIDPVSCTGSWMTLVSNAMLNAFKMANAGINMGQNPDAGQMTLIISLFGIQTRYDNYVDSVFGTTSGVLRFEGNQVFSRETLQKDDLQIYCDQDRYQAMPKRTQYYFDPNIKAADFFMAYQDECSTTKAFKKNMVPTLAYTIHPNPEEYQGTSVDWPWQIQICPWLLSEADSWKFQFTAGLGTQLMGKVAQAVIPILTDFTKVDKLSLFDKVLLHELTHTVADPDYVTKDVKYDDIDGYGWAICRLIAANTNQGVQNADSWALYGSASLLRQKGVTINADGSITKP